MTTRTLAKPLDKAKRNEKRLAALSMRTSELEAQGLTREAASRSAYRFVLALNDAKLVRYIG